MMTPLEWALEYTSRGWSVLPLYPIVNGKCSCPDRTYKIGPDPSKWKCSPGKHPFGNLVHGVKDATSDPDRARLWWGQMWPSAGIGIALAPSGLLDVAPDDVEDLAEFIARGLPETLSFRSGGGDGHQHFLYRLPPGIPQARLCVPGHYDIMSDGYCAAPPTLHQSGGRYVWQRFGINLTVAGPPDWAIELLQLQVQGRTPAASASVPGDAILGENGQPPLDIDPDVWQGIAATDRSGGLWAIAGELAQAGANEATIVEALRERDEALGWNKFAKRSDRERRYVETARRQLANVMPRVRLNGHVSVAESDVDVEAESEDPLPSVPVFPAEALPNVMQRLIEDSSLPAALLAGAYLAATAIAIGGNVEAYYEQFFVERLNLFVALVGKPGSGKSESQKQPLRPVQKWDAERFREYRAERERWLNRTTEQKKLDKENGVREPRDPRILVGSATIEATEHRFMAQAALGIYRDELVGFLKQVNGRYRQKGDDDTDWVLERWDGAPILTDRRGVGGPSGQNGILIYVERPTLVLLGSIQPSRQRYLGVDTEGGRSRWSLFMVEGTTQTVMRNPHPADVEVYERTIARLLTWRQSPRRWLIDAPVKRRLDELGEQWAIRARSGQASPTTLAALMKATRQVVRFAVNLAEFERALFDADQPEQDQTLTVEVLDRAAHIVEYNVAVWDAVGDGTPFARTSALGHLDEPIPHILQYLEQVGGGPIQTWQLYRHHVGGITSRKDLDPVLARYAERYPGTVDDTPSTGGRPGQTIRLPLRKA
jgi:Protein of unknown function (DUF3987)/Bifunctional DNA primase/polymerase, N-terminal